MNTLQNEINTVATDVPITILGMNQIGHEIGNDSTTEGRDIPWLQDVDANADGDSDVWLTSWDFVYRDVVIVDANNEFVEAYNLTQNDLGEPANFNAHKQMLIDAAGAAWNNKVNHRDVDDNGVVMPLDAF